MSECNYTASKCRFYTDSCKNCKSVYEIAGIKFCGKCDSNVTIHQRIRTELSIKGINCINCDNYTKNINSAKCLKCMEQLKEQKND